MLPPRLPAILQTRRRARRRLPWVLGAVFFGAGLRVEQDRGRSPLRLLDAPEPLACCPAEQPVAASLRPSVRLLLNLKDRRSAPPGHPSRAEATPDPIKGVLARRTVASGVETEEVTMPEVGGEFVVDGAHISAEAAREGETLKVRIEGARGHYFVW